MQELNATPSGAAAPTLNTNQKAFLALVRRGFGHPGADLPEQLDWPAVLQLASQHDLSAVALDGINTLPQDQRPPEELSLSLIGEVLQFFGIRYKLYLRTIAEMAAFFNSHDIKMMIIKGYACSLNWPKPERRPCGDIDIWQFGDYRKADALVQSEKGIKVDNSHHHHTVFNWNYFMVENHFDFVNVHEHRSNAAVEKILKELGQDDSHYTELDGERVYLPSPNLHALFLMRHTLVHFAAQSVTLRLVLDWGFFVRAHHDQVDWPWLEQTLAQFGMMDFYAILNTICVEDLGFDAALFAPHPVDPVMKTRVLYEIIEPEYSTDLPTGVLPRLAYKMRRWRANAWKYNLCFHDSRFGAFFTSVWSHLLKPASILSLEPKD